MSSGKRDPFIEAADPSAALLESVRQQVVDSLQVKREFFEENADGLLDAARAIATVYRGGGRMLAMGNGSSNCDAAGFAVAFLHPITAGRPALAALNLSGDTAMVTAVASDMGFEHAFARQIIALGRAGDGLIGFSTSGKSANLLAAFAQAKAMGLTTVGLAGGDGGTMAASADLDHCLVVRSDSIHRVQETHVAIYHILCDLVHALLTLSPGKTAT